VFVRTYKLCVTTHDEYSLLQPKLVTINESGCVNTGHFFQHGAG